MKWILFLITVSILSSSFAQIDRAFATLNVEVKDFNGNFKEGETIYFEGVLTKEVYKSTSDSEGKFKISLKGGDTYLIKIKEIGKEKEYNKITIPSLPEGQRYAENLLTIQFESSKVFTLNNIYFDSGKSVLSNQAQDELEELLDYMLRKKELRIEVAGHTDAVGEESDNIRLSKKRAEAVKIFLIRGGVASDRIITIGHGEAKPVSDNSTISGRQKNRRIEVRVLT